MMFANIFIKVHAAVAQLAGGVALRKQIVWVRIPLAVLIGGVV